MPTSIEQYKIFLSSPDDLQEERLMVENIVHLLNRLLEQSHGVQLKLLKWETDVYPAIGSSVQQVINAQIGDKYDIFIGLLWKKYGTPTTEAGSGTEEEFENAYKKYKNNPSSVKIMFYFKTNPPISLNDIDPKEMQRIIAFKQNLGSKGVLYDEFTDLSHFQQLLQLHLLQTITNLRAIPKDIPSNTEDDSLATSSEPKEDDIGLLDMLEQSESAMNRVTEIVSRMGEEMINFTESTVDTTEKINRVTRSGSQSQKIREPKRIIDQYAEQMANTNSKFEQLLTDYKDQAYMAFGNFIDALITAENSEIKESNGYKEALAIISVLKERLNESISTYKNLRETILEGVGMTTKLIKARNNFSKTIDMMIIEFENSLSLLKQIEK